jgi:hypothetical protein
MSKMPMFSTADFTYDKGRKRLLGEASTLGIGPGRTFPKELTVRSAHTGRVVRWVYDEQAAAANEWWDGMEAHYRTYAPQCNADTLVIIND